MYSNLYSPVSKNLKCTHIFYLILFIYFYFFCRPFQNDLQDFSVLKINCENPIARKREFHRLVLQKVFLSALPPRGGLGLEVIESVFLFDINWIRFTHSFEKR